MNNKSQRKYKLLKSDTFRRNGKTLYRIQALKSFGLVKRGDLGGYIEKEDNLEHRGKCLGLRERTSI